MLALGIGNRPAQLDEAHQQVERHHAVRAATNRVAQYAVGRNWNAGAGICVTNTGQLCLMITVWGTRKSSRRSRRTASRSDSVDIFSHALRSNWLYISIDTYPILNIAMMVGFG
jgi:hypothetical protein